MRYWKKKIKYEYGINIKKIKLKNEHRVYTCYIAYETADNNSINIKNRVFKDPKDIWKYLKDNEVTNNE